MDIVFIVGLIESCSERFDDVDHFCSGIPLFITRDKQKAINQFILIRQNIPESDLYQFGCRFFYYPGIVVMERSGNCYRPVQECCVNSLIDHHIGVEGFFPLCDLPEGDTSLDDDLYCVGLVGDMQYFTGCFISLEVTRRAAKNKMNYFQNNIRDVEASCFQRVSCEGGKVLWIDK